MGDRRFCVHECPLLVLIADIPPKIAQLFQAIPRSQLNRTGSFCTSPPSQVSVVVFLTLFAAHLPSSPPSSLAGRLCSHLCIRSRRSTAQDPHLHCHDHVPRGRCWDGHHPHPRAWIGVEGRPARSHPDLDSGSWWCEMGRGTPADDRGPA
jgi:hypothetical protein